MELNFASGGVVSLLSLGVVFFKFIWLSVYFAFLDPRVDVLNY